MNNVTYSAKKSEIERKWYIIDAANKPLGRVATEAARLLAGKHKPIYTKNDEKAILFAVNSHDDGRGYYILLCRG